MSGESGFQLSENAAEYYEQFSGPIMDPFIDEMISWAAPTAGGRLLDVACGTGRLARCAFAAMHYNGRADGLDVNEQMLEVARAEGLKTGAEFTWHAASAEDMPFANNSFDFVLCSQGIMFFPDLRQGLDEMVRVATPGGRIVCSFWAGPISRSPYMDATFRVLEGMGIGGATIFEQAWRVESESVAAMLGDAGCIDLRAEEVVRDIHLPSMKEYLPLHVAGLPFASEFQALPQHARTKFFEQVGVAMESFTNDDESVTVPFAVSLVSAVKR